MVRWWCAVGAVALPWTRPTWVGRSPRRSSRQAVRSSRITASRRFHNLAVEEYNVSLRQFPGSLVGGYRRLSARRPFDLGIERLIFDEPVTVKF